MTCIGREYGGVARASQPDRPDLRSSGGSIIVDRNPLHQIVPALERPDSSTRRSLATRARPVACLRRGDWRAALTARRLALTLVGLSLLLRAEDARAQDEAPRLDFHARFVALASRPA